MEKRTYQTGKNVICYTNPPNIIPKIFKRKKHPEIDRPCLFCFGGDLLDRLHHFLRESAGASRVDPAGAA